MVALRRRLRVASPCDRGRPQPRRLYAELADALAENGTAAEINFHLNSPDAEFFAECISRGVKISLGSDAHQSHEAAALAQNVSLLKQVAGADDIQHLLFQSPRRASL